MSYFSIKGNNDFPLEKILIETDSPFLSPEPMRGKKNEPSFIKYTANKLAQLKEINFEEINKITTNNFNSLFSNANSTQLNLIQMGISVSLF